MFSHFFIKYASSGEEVIKKIDRAALLLLLPPAAPPPSTGWMLLRFSNFSQTNLSVLVFEYKKQKAWKYHSVIPLAVVHYFLSTSKITFQFLFVWERSSPPKKKSVNLHFTFSFSGRWSSRIDPNASPKEAGLFTTPLNWVHFLDWKEWKRSENSSVWKVPFFTDAGWEHGLAQKMALKLSS